MRQVLEQRRAARITFDGALRVVRADAMAMLLSHGRARPGAPFETLLPHLVGGTLDFAPDPHRLPVSHCRRLVTSGGASAWLFNFARSGPHVLCRFEPLEWGLGFAPDSDVPIFVTGERGEPVYANRVLRARLGVGPEAPGDLSFDAIASALCLDGEAVRRMLEGARRGGSLRHEVDAPGALASLEAAPLRYFGQLCGTVWSVHETLAPAAPDRHTLAVLAYRLAAMYQHEMRNPLQTVAAACAMLRARDTAGTFADLLQVMERNVEHLSEILSEHLMPGVQDAPPPATRLSAVVERAIADAKLRQSSRFVTFAHEVPPQEPAVRCHAAAAARAFANLFRNASQARPDACIRVSYAWDASEMRCVVQDDGPGLPEAVLQGALLAADPTRHFGLFLVAATVEAGGGRLALTNAPGGGARVTLWFPLAREGGEPLARAGAGDGLRA